MTADTLPLTDWLLEQIADDEAAAQAATPGPWYADDVYLTITGEPFKSAREAYDRGDCDIDCWVISESDGGGVSSHNLPHIALHDPARVLAQCAAFRAIVAAHPHQDTAEWDMGLWCTTCQWDICCDQPGTNAGRDGTYPCLTLRALASIFRDRPGWQEAWA